MGSLQVWLWDHGYDRLGNAVSTARWIAWNVLHPLT